VTPSRTARWSTGSARPSISRNSRPGTSVDTRDRERVLVVVQTRHGDNRRADRRRDERHQHRVGESRQLDRLGRDVSGQREHPRVEHEHEQEAGEHRERKSQRGDQRWQDRVEHRDDGRDQERAGKPVDVSARDPGCG
jgi:hypothetical protein